MQLYETCAGERPGPSIRYAGYVAPGGRRIVAVTHIDAVSARADQVLGVASSESGSRAAWRGAELGTAV